MHEFKKSTLEEVLSVLESGSRPSGGVDTESGTIPSLGGENIRQDGHMCYNVIKKVHDSFYRNMPRGLLLPYDVLINKDGAQTGKVAIYKGDFSHAAINEHLFLMRGKRDVIEQRFLCYYLLYGAIQQQIIKMITGSAQPGINSGFTKHIILDIPSIEQQRRIAEILDTIDDAVQETEALISKLKAMKQGLLHDLLTCGLDENGKLRDPKAHQEQFKDSPLGRIPKEWHTTKLAKLVIRAEYGISVSLEDDSGIPVLRMNNLVAGEVDLSELKYSKSREASNLLLNPRDVLFNRTNSMEHVGRTAIWRGQLEGTSFASYLVRIVPDYSKLIPEYLNLWLNSQSTQILIRKYATPSVHQVNINPTNLQKADITLPQSVEEQYTIVDAADAHDASIRTEEQYRDKLKLQKKGLMHDLLTGKVRVKV